MRVPDGARAGDPLSVLASWGDKFMLNVPSGVKPNHVRLELRVIPSGGMLANLDGEVGAFAIASLRCSK